MAAVSTQKITQRDNLIDTAQARTLRIRLPDIHLYLKESEDYFAEESKHENYNAKKINANQNLQTNCTVIFRGVVFGDRSTNLMDFVDQIMRAAIHNF